MSKSTRSIFSTVVSRLLVACLFTPFTVSADDNKETDPIFTDSSLKGNSDVQIILGMSDAVLATWLLGSASQDLTPENIDNRIKMLQDAEEKLEAAKELSTEAEVASKSRNLESSLDFLKNQLSDLAEDSDSAENVSQKIDDLIPKIADLKATETVSDSFKASAIEAASKEVAEIRASMLQTVIKTGKVPLYKKVLRSESCGWFGFIADLGGRIYLWNSEEVNPGFFPAGRYSAVQLKKFATGSLELYKNISEKQVRRRSKTHFAWIEGNNASQAQKLRVFFFNFHSFAVLHAGRCWMQGLI